MTPREIDALLEENRHLKARVLVLELEREFDAYANTKNMWLPLFGEQACERIEMLEQKFAALKSVGVEIKDRSP